MDEEDCNEAVELDEAQLSRLAADVQFDDEVTTYYNDLGLGCGPHEADDEDMAYGLLDRGDEEGEDDARRLHD